MDPLGQQSRRGGGGWWWWGGTRLFNPLIVRKGRADPDTQPVMINMGCVQTPALLSSSHGAETQQIRIGAAFIKGKVW